MICTDALRKGRSFKSKMITTRALGIQISGANAMAEMHLEGLILFSSSLFGKIASSGDFLTFH
jgi:hypothetical protein